MPYRRGANRQEEIEILIRRQEGKNRKLFTCGHCRRPMNVRKVKRTQEPYCSRSCALLSRVNPADLQNPLGCWNWIGGKDSAGYGSLYVLGGMDRAHREAYRVFVADFGDEYVCHHCDNPQCINPRHLFLGTAGDNNRDRHAKGRTARGSLMPNATLTEDDVRDLRAGRVTIRDMMVRRGVSESAARNARRGLTWKHIELVA